MSCERRNESIDPASMTSFVAEQHHRAKVYSITIIAAILLSCVTISIVSDLPLSSPLPPENSRISALIPHSPILINGNAGFLGSNLSTGISRGNGTASNPYVIEGWEINASSSNAIEIRNADMHFVITDVYLHAQNQSNTLLNFVSCQNGTIENVTFSGSCNGGTIIYDSANISIENCNYTAVRSSCINGNTCNRLNISGNRFIDSIFGVSLFTGSHLNIQNNTFSNVSGCNVMEIDDSEISNNTFTDNGGTGIMVAHSSGSMIIQNNTFDNWTRGIEIASSTFVTLRNNSMVNGGLYMDGNQVECWNTHSIDVSNTVNGAPVYYIKDQIGGTVPMDGGQLILANCNGVDAENLYIINTSAPIILGFCTGCIIGNSSLKGSADGLEVYWCSSIRMFNVSCSENRRSGMEFMSSSHCIVRNCSLINNGDGLINEASDYCVIENCNLSSNREGIIISNSDHVGLLGCTLIMNTPLGVQLSNSLYTRISGNVMEECGVLISQGDLQDWTLQDIDASNTVNGRPIVYLRNLTGGIAPAGAGQVMLGNCTDFIIQNQNLSHTVAGIQLGCCSHITVSSNNLTNDYVGVYSCRCDNDTMLNNDARNCSNGYGIASLACADDYYEGNMLDGCQYGIGMVSCSRVYVDGNFCSHGQYGVWMSQSKNVTVINNNLCDNDFHGVYLQSSKRCNITQNLISDNLRYAVVLDYQSNNNHVWNNTFDSNNGVGSTYDAARTQAADSGSNNRWNTSGLVYNYGNYWSDLTAPDSDLDGIVDWSYNLSGNVGAKDYYPLTIGPVIPEPPIFILMILMSAIFLIARHRKKHLSL